MYCTCTCTEPLDTVSSDGSSILGPGVVYGGLIVHILVCRLSSFLTSILISQN